MEEKELQPRGWLLRGERLERRKPPKIEETEQAEGDREDGFEEKAAT